MCTVQLTSFQSDKENAKQSQDTTDFIGDLPNEDEGLTFSLPPVVSSTPPAIEERVKILKICDIFLIIACTYIECMLFCKLSVYRKS